MNKKYLFRLITGFLLSLISYVCAAEVIYHSQDAQQCQHLEWDCEDGKSAFFDEQGCGCQSTEFADCAALAGLRAYHLPDVEACQQADFACSDSQVRFFDEQGCGCQQKTTAEIACTMGRQLIELSGLYFSVPRSWEGQSGEIGQSWMVTQPMFFQVQSIVLEKDWVPKDFLPEGTEIIEQQPLQVTWGKGLLYRLQTEDSEGLMAIMPRAAANQVFVFSLHAAGPSATDDLKAILDDVLASVTLQPIKHYLPDLGVEECAISILKCPPVRQPFRDSKGCGCLTPVDNSR